MATTPEPLITFEQLENRLSKVVHLRVFNDNDVGEVDTHPEEQLRRDASSKVRGGLPNIPVDELLATNDEFSEELRRITLDVAHAMCAIRSPSVFAGIDGFALMELSEKDLLRLRNNQTTLATNPDDPLGDETDGSGSTANSPFTVSSGVERGWNSDYGV